MDEYLLKKFLAGEATDEECRRCETLLDSPDTVIDDEQVEVSDSFVQSARATNDLDESAEMSSLIERIQRLVPRKAISKEELDRILDPPLAGDEMGRIGRYRVVEFIAVGGMGIVFKGEDVDLARPVCIKVMHPMLASNPEAKLRFDRESRAAARLRNDRIVTVFDVGEHRDLPYLVMQLLEGESLRSRLDAQGPLGEATSVRLAKQMAEGLGYAHDLGYLHRDIKPDNVWITPGGDVKLLDFGLARAVHESVVLTGSGTVIGTPSYMSPEQVQGKELDARSDLFSLGTVFFEMLTGQSPFNRKNLFSTMMSVANDTLPLPADASINAVPGELEPVLRKLLEKDPERRFATAAEVIAALDQNQLPAKTQTRTGWSGLRRARTAIAGGLAGAFLVLLSILIYVQTDKGTLVITADESVELRIADGQITIVDPAREKTYDVFIGEHRLPSGVYQLEMKDPSGELVFSSSVIAIRRGKEEIVTIELRPPDVHLAGDRPTTPGTTPGTVQVTDFNLSGIRALDDLGTRRAMGYETGAPISAFASVQNPGTAPGITTWSIEPPRHLHRVTEIAISPDGQRYATAGAMDLVRIWTHGHKLTHLIPVGDHVVHLSWSPEENIVAVVCHGDKKREITIWRLGEEHAELIRAIAVDAVAMAWSPAGDQLAIQKPTEISFYDLAKGKEFAIPNFGISGSISRRPWSADMRYFATIQEDAVQLWDTTSGNIYHSFTNAEHAQWLPDSSRLILSRNERRLKTYELWDVKNLSRLKVLTLQKQWRQVSIDDQFERFAAVTADSLWLGRIGGASPQEYDLADQTFTPMESTQLHWSASGTHLLLWTGREVFMCRPGSNDERATIWRGDIIYTPRMYTDRRLETAYHDGRLYVPYRDLKQTEVFRANLFDIRRLRPIHEMLLGTASDARMSLTSPSLTAIAFLETNAAEEQIDPAERSPTVRIASLDDGRTLHEFTPKGVVKQLLWSQDETFLIVSSFRAVETRDSGLGKPRDYAIRDYAIPLVEILDLESGIKREISPSNEPIPLRSLQKVAIHGDQVVVPIKVRQISEGTRRSETVFHFGFFDIQTGEEERRIEQDQLSSLRDFEVSQKFVWLNGRQGRSSDMSDFLISLSDDPSQLRALHKNSFKGYRLRLSASGDFIYYLDQTTLQVWKTNSLDPNAVNPWSTDADFYLREGERGFFGDPTTSLKWHSNRPVLSWHNSKAIHWYDAESQRHTKYRKPRGISTLVSTDFGWLALDAAGVIAFGFAGDYLGRFFDNSIARDVFSTAKLDSWISAGGACQSGSFPLMKAVLLDGNRFVTIPLSKFKQDYNPNTPPSMPAILKAAD